VTELQFLRDPTGARPPATSRKVLLIGLSGSGKSRSIVSLDGRFAAADMDSMINTTTRYREREDLEDLYRMLISKPYELISVSVLRHFVAYLSEMKRSPSWRDHFDAVIYLRITDAEEHRRRLSLPPANGQERPQAQIEAVLKSAPVYDRLCIELADHIINVEHLSEAEVLQEVTRWIEKTRNVGHDSMPLFLTKADFDDQTSRIGGKHWESAGSRWAYHELAVQWAKELDLSSPADVLEMGPMGVTVINGSKTLDYDASKNNSDWLIEGYRPTYFLDARKTPWPFRDKEFELIVALRIFHHLTPNQRAGFLEARRTSKALILQVPTRGIHPRGIDREQLVEWNDGVGPVKERHFPGQLGSAYLFKW
jgi:hypothetical protein